MKDGQKQISLISLLYKCSPKLLMFAVAMGAAAGSLYGFIIPFVLRELNPIVGHADTTLNIDLDHKIIFVGMCLSILLAKAFSVITVNNIAKTAVAELRIDAANKINRTMIAHIEYTGFSRLLTILTEDVNNVAAAAIAIPMLLVSIVTVIGMLGYLAILNLYIFLIVLSAIFLGILIFQVPVAMVSGLYERARVLHDIIQEGIRGLVMGAYELKLNNHKSKVYINNELEQPQKKSVSLEKIGDAVLHIAGISSDLLSFFIIGIVVFILPSYLQFPASEIYGVVMVLLYIAGPVANILGMLRQLKVGEIALFRIQSLHALEEDSYNINSEVVLGPWTEFSIESASYCYPAQDCLQERPFLLAPVSLSFSTAQINFIVGGNGSGKSTLGKMLSLHYMPTAGSLCFDKKIICPKSIASARSKISVVFSNYYLFNKLYCHVTPTYEKKIDNYLMTLGLKGKTDFVNGSFTTTKLSDGQRRRLALLVALLEDKDIYIFDEWAADQDPEFKNIFYRVILQDMKRDNKLVIVITHDDRYFDCADRIITMEDGHVIDIKNAKLKATSESFKLNQIENSIAVIPA